MNILLIDDHALFRSGLATMLGNLEPSTYIADYPSYDAAVESTQSPEDIDLVLLDYHIPGTETTANLQAVRESFSQAKVVVISGEEDPGKIIIAIDHGASGFIPKSSEPPILIAALKLILAGGVYLPEQVLRIRGKKATGGGEVSLDKLSDRQRDVLNRAIDGKSNKAIARELGLSEGTIKAHLSYVYKSLGVTNRTEAVVLASQLLGLEPQEHAR